MLSCSQQHLALLSDGAKNINSFPSKHRDLPLFIIENSSKNCHRNKCLGSDFNLQDFRVMMSLL